MGLSIPTNNSLAGPLTQGRVLRSLDALPAWLDTLIPEDESPSATALGVDASIIASLHSNRTYQKLLLAGCEWLDQQAESITHTDFASADDKTREAIASQAASADHDSLENTFFQYTRNAAFSFYYADPVSWPSLQYQGPPQPLGFMDFERPPG